MQGTFWELMAWGGPTGVGIGFGIVICRTLIDRTFGRLDKREAHLDEATQLLIKGLTSQVAVLTGDWTDLRGRVSAAEAQLRECLDKHAAAEAKVVRLEKRIGAEEQRK